MMPQSLALVIINDERSTKYIEDIKTKLYFMNMRVAVLENKTTLEIKNLVTELTKIEGSNILDIVCVIRSIQASERQFITSDGIIDIYVDIIHPIMRVESFKDKIKLIIKSGIENNTAVEYVGMTDSENRLYSHGANTCIVSSKENNFISTFMEKLVSSDGRIDVALKECDYLDIGHISTALNLKLGTHSKSYTDDSPFLP